MISRRILRAWRATPPSVERAIQAMENGRAPGSDLFMAEYLKFWGPLLHQELADLVT